MQDYCTKMFVSGIHATATIYQIYDFFKALTPNVVQIHNVRSKCPAIQNVVVEYLDHNSAIKAIDAVNFKRCDGFILKAYLFHQDVYNANKNQKSNVTLHFPIDNDMKHITERFLFERLKVFGPIINIRVRRDLHMAFCHFIKEEDALSATEGIYLDGIRCELKTPKPKNSRKKKNIKA